jgi:hypothetical protein
MIENINDSDSDSDFDAEFEDVKNATEKYEKNLNLLFKLITNSCNIVASIFVWSKQMTITSL